MDARAVIPAYLFPTTAANVLARHLFLMTGNINLTPPYNLDSLDNNAYYPDVACLTDNSSGTPVQMAEISYIGAGGLMLAEYNYTTPPVPSWLPILSATTLDAGTHFLPRIEAMSQYDAFASPYAAKYQVVSAKTVTGLFTTQQAWGYNDIAAPTWLSDMYVLNSDSDCKSPCVAAGIGPAFSSDIGNQQYTVGFFPRSKTEIIERIVDPFTGATNSRWWEANCTPVNYSWDAARSMSVSNCSNSGFNLLTAWFDGTTILYKESPNTMAFKTTGLGQAAAGAISAYPNPVGGLLHIDGVAGNRFCITDVTGKGLIQGKISPGGTVDLRHLQPGMYLLRLTGENSPLISLKFIKE